MWKQKRLISILAIYILGLFAPLFLSAPTDAAFPGYNGRVVFASTRDTSGTDYEIFTMNPDGTGATRLTTSVGVDYMPAMSPDNTRIAFVSNRSGSNQIFVMDVDGSDVVQLTNFVGRNSTYPSWSPDGTRIAFGSNKDGSTNEIYTMDANGSNLTRITNNATNDFQPTFSPDGSKFLYTCTSGGALQICTMNVNGTGSVALAPITSPSTNAASDWSPDGTKIVFDSNRTGGVREIYTMNADGSNVTKLTSGSTSSLYKSDPSWSPEGDKIMYTSRQDGGDPELYIMGTDGSGQTRVTNTLGVDTYGEWEALSAPGSFSTATAGSAAILGYSQIATHPGAASQSTLAGSALKQLEVFNNKLYVGYGDATTNTGPIEINPFDFSTRSFTGSQLTIPTEIVHVFRKLNNNLYTTYTDPLGSDPGGIAYGEPWQLKAPLTGVHFMDIATLNGSDLWMAGVNASGAVVWHSTNNGDSWSVSRTDVTAAAQYNWIATLNGKIYTQSSVVGTPVQVYDGTSWSAGTTSFVATGGEYPIEFKNRLVTRANGLSTFDGTNVEEVSSFQGTARDYYVNNGYLYVLRTDNTVARTIDFANWQELGVAPAPVFSMVVYNNRIYLGGLNGKIYESELIDVALARVASAGGELAKTGYEYLYTTIASGLLIAAASYVVLSRRHAFYAIRR